MDHNRLKGVEGDRIKAILCAAGMNFWKLLKRVANFSKFFYGFNLVNEQVFAKFPARCEFFRIDYDRSIKSVEKAPGWQGENRMQTDLLDAIDPGRNFTLESAGKG